MRHREMRQRRCCLAKYAVKNPEPQGERRAADTEVTVPCREAAVAFTRRRRAEDQSKRNIQRTRDQF